MQQQIPYGSVRHQYPKLALSVYESHIMSEGPVPCIRCILIGALVGQGTEPFTYRVISIHISAKIEPQSREERSLA